MRRPWLAIALAGGVLLALAIPALSMNIVQTSTDDLPQNLAVIKTYNRIKAAFPKEAVHGRRRRQGQGRAQRAGGRRRSRSS